MTDTAGGGVVLAFVGFFILILLGALAYITMGAQMLPTVPVTVGTLNKHATDGHGWEAKCAHSWICEYDEKGQRDRQWDCGKSGLVFVDLMEDGRWAFVATTPAGRVKTAFITGNAHYIARKIRNCDNPTMRYPEGMPIEVLQQFGLWP